MGDQYWLAKDYFNGLHVGLYLVQDQLLSDTLMKFARGDYMLFWALLPASIRAKQQANLRENIGQFQNVFKCIEAYEDARGPLRTTILAGLELTLNPPKMLRRFVPPPAFLSAQYDDHLKDIREGKMISNEDYGLWVWAAAKYYNSRSAWNFWMQLDMNLTGVFSRLGEWVDNDSDEPATPNGITMCSFPVVLEYLTLRDIARLSAVSSVLRRDVWMCFFDNPPQTYIQLHDGFYPVWNKSFVAL